MDKNSSSINNSNNNNKLESESGAKDLFGKNLNDIVNKTYTGIALALGLQLGLFEPLLDGGQKTCEEISLETNCKSRYVKEWLSIMTVAELIDSKDGQTFSIATERKHLFLSRNPDMIKITLLPMLAMNVFDKIAECFKKDGPQGTKYEDYKSFAALIAKPDSVRENDFFNNIFIHKPEIAQRLKMGCHYLDIGCGSGTASRVLAKAFPQSQCYGIDFCENAVKTAQEGANYSEENKGVSNNKNLQYFVMDATKLKSEWSNFFDYVTTFDSVHDQAHPHLSLAEIYRVLKPGGIYSMIDIDAHSNVLENKSKADAPILYTISLFHCMAVSLGAAEDGMGLGTMWGREKAAEMLKKAGFVNIHFYPLKDDMLWNYHCFCEKPIVN